MARGKLHSTTAVKPKTKQNGYDKTCPACLVCASISEQTLLRNLAQGIEDQGFMVVRKDGASVSGTPYGMIQYLVKSLRLKGIEVTE